jgi:DNA polymerase-1
LIDPSRLTDRLRPLRYRLITEILALRSFFKAKEGYKFVIADYSQQDLRVIAGLADDLRTIETFKEERDLYLEIAQEITGKPEKECREFRKMAKIIVLGLMNGMSEYSVHEKINEDIGVNMSLEEVRLLINRFFELHPSIKYWRDNSVREARTKGFISTPLGRYLHVDEDTKTTPYSTSWSRRHKQMDSNWL